MAAFITDISMQDASAFFGRLATNNYYQVVIGNSWRPKFLNAMNDWGPKINLLTYGETLGLLCTDATIPASTYATAEVKDNYIGIPQEFAHTRLYTDVDFTFYVDRNYQVLSFFEFWMNFIGGGAEVAAASPNNTNGNVYRRFQYPEDYKTSQFYIIKFERDYKKVGTPKLQYQLINAFPKAVTSIPISYGPTDLLKVTVTMNYDRYVVTKDLTPAAAPKPAATQTPGTQPAAPAAATTQRVPNRPRTRNEVITGGFIR